MASNKSPDDEAVVFGDEFLADEILARLPVRCAARCTVLSKHFRQLVKSAHFWLRHGRLGPPPELPHVARLYRHESGMGFEFHVVGPGFAMKHTVDADRSSYAGTCNGLVLVSRDSYSFKGQSSVEGIVFNPATKEEARLSLPLPHPEKEDMWCRIFGFGYGPSSKVYKALIRESHNGRTRLMVVSMDGGGDGQEPRTVFSCDDEMLCHHSLHTGDGKVYFLIFTIYYIDCEERYEVEDYVVTMVLAFDVDDEVATSIAVPEGEERNISDSMMLEVRGRPCIYKRKGQYTVIWLLTPDHRWEQLYILVNENAQPDDYFAGAWDCGGDLLLALFKISGAYLYNLREAAVEDKQGSGSRLAALSSLTIEYERPEQINRTWFGESSNLLDYRPTLISPASIVGDVALSDRPPRCIVRKHDELGGMFLEMTQKCVIGPARQMLTKL
ncbi:unnamed protein product [Alopecurus aequalis]